MCNSASRRVIAVALSVAMLLVCWAPVSASTDDLVPRRKEHRALTFGGLPLWQAVNEPSGLFTRTTPQASRPAPKGRNHVMLWGGVGLAALGASVTVWGLAPNADAFCFNHSEDSGPLMVQDGSGSRLALDGECTPTTHLSGMFWTGLGMAALGTTFAVMGASASVQPGGIGITKTLTF